jgi:hypothetical protein
MEFTALRRAFFFPVCLYIYIYIYKYVNTRSRPNAQDAEVRRRRGFYGNVRKGVRRVRMPSKEKGVEREKEGRDGRTDFLKQTGLYFEKERNN